MENGEWSAMAPEALDLEYTHADIVDVDLDSNKNKNQHEKSRINDVQENKLQGENDCDSSQDSSDSYESIPDIDAFEITNVNVIDEKKTNNDEKSDVKLTAITQIRTYDLSITYDKYYRVCTFVFSFGLVNLV